MFRGVTIKTTFVVPVIACLLILVIGLACAQDGPEGAAPSSAGAASQATSAQIQPEGIYLEGFRLDIIRQGKTRQKLQAANGHYDQSAETLDLNELRVNFFDAETTRGQAVSGHGRVWLKEQPGGKIGKNDIHLDQTVRFITGEGWILQSPEMWFTQKDSTLRSDQGYVKQLPMATGYLVARGKSFAIALSLDENTFTHWREMGDPRTGEQVTFKKSDEPVI